MLLLFHRVSGTLDFASKALIESRHVTGKRILHQDCKITQLVGARLIHERLDGDRISTLPLQKR